MRLIPIFAGLLAFASSVSTSMAKDEGIPFLNHSGLAISGMSLSAPGAEHWGPDLFAGNGDGTIDTGKSRAINGLRIGVFDIKITISGKSPACIIRNVVVSKSGLLLDKKMVQVCKIDGSYLMEPST